MAQCLSQAGLACMVLAQAVCNLQTNNTHPLVLHAVQKGSVWLIHAAKGRCARCGMNEGTEGRTAQAWLSCLESDRCPLSGTSGEL